MGSQGLQGVAMDPGGRKGARLEEGAFVQRGARAGRLRESDSGVTARLERGVLVEREASVHEQVPSQLHLPPLTRV